MKIRQGVTLKIFAVTSVLLIIFAMLLYLALYFFLPKFYYSYKESDMANKVEQLAQQLISVSWESNDAVLAEFELQNNVRVVVRDSEGKVIFPSSSVYGNDQFLEFLLRGGPPPGFVEPYKSGARLPEPGEPGGRSQVDASWPSFLSVSKSFQPVGSENVYQLLVNSPLQPIDEASQVVASLMPIIAIIIVGIALIGAAVYSRLIAKPLLHLNQVATRMARLDFSSSSDIKSKDELGELAANLNKLASNLEASLTDLTRSNAQLKDDIQKEREQEVKRREFIATISHELKTPITAISGQLEGMIHHVGAYKDRDKYLRQSYRIIKDMEKLVYEILDISQLDSFDFKPRFEPIDLSVLIERTGARFAALAESREVSLWFKLEPGVWVDADQKLLARALSNIISNAVYYTENNERVNVSLHRLDTGIRFSVVNTGASIDQSSIDHLFQPFYRVEKSRSRKTGGSGLGLYIVKRILEMHHLSYLIRNVEEGVEFEIMFSLD